MKIGIKVGDIMTRQLVAVKPCTNINECAKTMAKNNVGLVIVQENEKLRGMLTEKEVIWALTKKQDLSRVKAKDIMLRKITTIKPSRDIYDALLRMKNAKLRWLPVTIKGNVIGLLTINDILRIEPGLFEITSSNMRIKEETNKLKRKKAVLDGRYLADEGECEECSSFGLVYNNKGKLLCENCADIY